MIRTALVCAHWSFQRHKRSGSSRLHISHDDFVIISWTCWACWTKNYFLLQSATGWYYKLRQLFYYKVRQALLKSARGNYKVPQGLLQVRQVLQKCDVIKKCDGTGSLLYVFILHKRKPKLQAVIYLMKPQETSLCYPGLWQEPYVNSKELFCLKVPFVEYFVFIFHSVQ